MKNKDFSAKDTHFEHYIRALHFKFDDLDRIDIVKKHAWKLLYGQKLKRNEKVQLQ